ncbi:YwqH-like family protein [Peribacillus glennii]|uniref:YwqH-like family protein n=1 Tax=Peribacillus glennii TaxID=2303991 RepID=UPI001313E8A5|nr:DUF5082 domain-containing protein [Peribacillus glennii]
MLAYLYERLREKQEHLVRLYACKANLEGAQDEFISYEKTCTEPELSAETWQGKWATEFQDIRNDGILLQYKNLAHQQLNHSITSVEAAITETKLEIENIRNQIEAAEEQARREREKARQQQKSV